MLCPDDEEPTTFSVTTDVRMCEALSRLDPDLRRSMLMEGVLAEARTSESLAAFVHQLDIIDHRLRKPGADHRCADRSHDLLPASHRDHREVADCA